jgi:hypothetical protein
MQAAEDGSAVPEGGREGRRRRRPFGFHHDLRIRDSTAVLLIMAMGMALAASPAQAWVITATGTIYSDGPYSTPTKRAYSARPVCHWWDAPTRK